MTEIAFQSWNSVAVIRFLCLSVKSNGAILESLHSTYGPGCIQMRSVATWAARFLSWSSSLEDDPRSCRPPDDDAKERVLSHLSDDPHMSVRSAAAELVLSGEFVRRALRDARLRFVTTKWVPHDLTEEQMKRRVDVSGELLGVIGEMTELQLAHLRHLR